MEQPDHGLAACLSQQLEAGEVFVRCGVAQLDKPGGETELLGDGGDGPRVGAGLQRVD